MLGARGVVSDGHVASVQSSRDENDVERRQGPRSAVAFPRYGMLASFLLPRSPSFLCSGNTDTLSGHCRREDGRSVRGATADEPAPPGRGQLARRQFMHICLPDIELGMGCDSRPSSEVSSSQGPSVGLVLCPIPADCWFHFRSVTSFSTAHSPSIPSPTPMCRARPPCGMRRCCSRNNG